MNSHHESLADLLDRLTAPAQLYDKLPDQAVRCFACAHRCLIREGRRGICQVRFNAGGVLYAPHGYAAGIQSDPIEKKPFYHVLPGADALTFGMLGCDMHCDYCFPGDTSVVTQAGPKTLAQIFVCTEHRQKTDDAEIGYPTGAYVVTASGQTRKVRAVFRHEYEGMLTRITPYYLPDLRCTPDHRIYATAAIDAPPTPIRACDLTENHWLVVPRGYTFSADQVIDVKKEIGHIQTPYSVPWKYSQEDYKRIKQLTEEGLSSNEIGKIFETSGSNIRHVRRRLTNRLMEEVRTQVPILENGSIRFPNERRPGIHTYIPFNTAMARLFGLYCAEGCVVTSASRPNSHTLNFSFAPEEIDLAAETQKLLKTTFGIQAQVVQRDTTIGIAIGKASLALLCKALAGAKSADKRVPEHLFQAPCEVVQAFLDAYVEGDGHRYKNGKISITTVSEEMAYGTAWLALKLGHLPSIYVNERPSMGEIEGRAVQQAPKQFVVVWYENAKIKRKMVEQTDCFLVPIRSITSEPHNGPVYNLEVEEEHNFLANFFLVCNCQNWLTSQALRHDAAGVRPTRVSAAQLIGLAQQAGAKAMVSSYNEPLITTEWAVEVFQQARAHDLICGFVSNGNATAEALDYLRPWAQCYKIDLKTMQDRNYRQLGAVLQHILDGIRMVHERGFWLEIVTLLVPGFNDAEAELRDLAGFIAAVSPDIPWHVTAFHPDYQMTGQRATTARDLLRAAVIGKEAGLHFVYAGNLPGQIGDFAHTFCPGCGQVLIERTGFQIRSYRLTPAGTCPACAAVIPGIWP